MDTAIETVSTVLGQDPEYHELTATYLREIANAESTFGSKTVADYMNHGV